MVFDDQHRGELVRSGLFDVHWYLADNPDIRDAGVDPVEHYVACGAAEGRDPNPLFDTEWYLAEIGCSIDIDPLTHYLRVGAAEGRHPHPMFDSDWYCARYLQDEPVGVVALAHYLFLWPLLDLQPNAVFSPRFYLKEYPDVAASGLDPHVHYARHGASEGRRPSADFDPDYYSRELPAAERESYKGRLIEHYLRHGRRSGLNPKRRCDPIRDPAQREQLVATIDRAKPTAAMIFHGQGGGVRKHVVDLVELCRERINALFVVLQSDGSIRLSLPDAEPDSSLWFDPKAEFDGFVAVLEECAVARLHIHHFFGNTELERLVDRLSVPFDLTIHDYFCLAPQPHLVDAGGRFVGEDLAKAEPQLCGGSVASEPVVSLRDWRRKNRWLLAKAERVIAPSIDAARRFSRYYPDLPIIVAPHIDTESPAISVAVEGLDELEPLRIALIGTLGPHKGYATLLDAAQQVEASRAPLCFMVIGGSVNDEALRQAGVSVTGDYNGCDLPTLLRTSRPHLLWYPSQCPETYCYALSEGFGAGLPVVVPDIGAFAERVSGRSWSWVRPWSWAAGDWVDFFLAIRVQHFLTGTAPPAPSGIRSPPSEFYSRDYLAWTADKLLAL